MQKATSAPGGKTKENPFDAGPQAAIQVWA